ncbi:MAG: hypothetical protein QW728_03940 [Thermoplasmata archaeon]
MSSEAGISSNTIYTSMGVIALIVIVSIFSGMVSDTSVVYKRISLKEIVDSPENYDGQMCALYNMKVLNLSNGTMTTRYYLNVTEDDISESVFVIVKKNSKAPPLDQIANHSDKKIHINGGVVLLRGGNRTVPQIIVEENGQDSLVLVGEESDLTTLMWDWRSVDIIAQAVIIFVGVLGVMALVYKYRTGEE